MEYALALFQYQAKEVPVYRQYITQLGVNPSKVNSVEDIPFLPISFFKSHSVLASEHQSQLVFESSRTTGQTPSRHYLPYPSLYKENFLRLWNTFYGDPTERVILGLLPSYLDRQHSSLVYMVNQLIQHSNHPLSGFYLQNLNQLAENIKTLEKAKTPFVLLGVTFALLDLAEQHPMKLHHGIIMETGGMKGRRKEMVREEVHQLLKKGFQVSEIHSEYGMTELLSQAYSKGRGIFVPNNTLRVYPRDPQDPLRTKKTGSGGLNVIDLANQYSCAFIATQDLTKVAEDGSFEVLGRFDQAEVRGCNLMAV